MVDDLLACTGGSVTKGVTHHHRMSAVRGVQRARWAGRKDPCRKQRPEENAAGMMTSVTVMTETTPWSASS